MKTLLFVVCLFVVGAVSADDSENLLKNVSLTWRNDSCLAVGFCPFEGSTTSFATSFGYGNWDLGTWTALENENDFVMNETDVVFGYTFPISESFSVRLGVADWIFPGYRNHSVLEFDAFYSGLIDTRLSVDYSLTDSGTQWKLIMSKSPIALGSLMRGSFSFVPSVEVVCADKFFGMTGCPSNVIYQGSLVVSWDKWALDFSPSYNDGGEYGGEEHFENGWKFGLGIKRFF